MMKTTKHDKTVAKAVIDLAKRHEESWDARQRKYTLGNFTGLLEKELKQFTGAFAQSLMLFSYWANDIVTLCGDVVNSELHEE